MAAPLDFGYAQRSHIGEVHWWAGKMRAFNGAWVGSCSLVYWTSLKPARPFRETSRSPL
jgi:hypothetical protein